MALEAEYSRSQEEAGLMMPRLPSLAGRAKSWRSRSSGAGLPVIAGISWKRSKSSNFESEMTSQRWCRTNRTIYSKDHG